MNRSLAASALAGLLAFVMGIFLMTPVANAKAQELTTVSNIAVASYPRSEVPQLESLKILSNLKVPQQKKPTPTNTIVDYTVLAQRAAAAKKVKAKVAIVKTHKVSPVVKKKSTIKHRKRTSTYTGRIGRTSGYNWATPGQCTWGAMIKWHAATGTYLGGFHGNAYTWNERARSAGYSVGTTPRTRSIVVFEPGVANSSSVGHVAWVIGVSGSRVTFVEMNGSAGPFNWSTRTVTNRGGMSYIYAP